ncbi:phospholipid-translocating P-type ATPase [Ceratocystis lukuohia]|uniref:Phospholipid-transporting ATPase n=1 Tax=Ceratocystis lukuohia TaxID=2019550 RepID=A0ABR4MBV6_9PEZI
MSSFNQSQGQADAVDEDSSHARHPQINSQQPSTAQRHADVAYAQPSGLDDYGLYDSNNPGQTHQYQSQPHSRHGQEQRPQEQHSPQPQHPPSQQQQPPYPIDSPGDPVLYPQSQQHQLPPPQIEIEDENNIRTTQVDYYDPNHTSHSHGLSTDAAIPVSPRLQFQDPRHASFTPSITPTVEMSVPGQAITTDDPNATSPTTPRFPPEGRSRNAPRSKGHLMSPSETHRARWATRKMTVKSSNNKRASIIGRLANRKSLIGEKKRMSVAESDEHDHDHDDDESVEEEEVASGRRLYFNLPLPDDLKDEEGHPAQQFPRNKVRTAKYTPLSFIPKNLYFQFHNVANIFFLFMVILVFFPIFGGENPGLNAAPLIFIVAVTAIKDAVEDSRRTSLDSELNNAPVHRLRHWENVNVEEDNVSLWRRIKKATSRISIGAWRFIKSIWSKKARTERKALKEAAIEEARKSVDFRQSMDSHHRASQGGIPLTPVASPIAPTADAEERARQRAQIVRTMKTDIVNHNAEASGRARFHKDTWKSIRVGDFVRIYNNDELPADVIILSTSEKDGACYVETKNLDGETNLKFRQALHCGRDMRHARDCERAQFWIQSEEPHANLYKFNGALKWYQDVPGDDTGEPELMTESITIDNMLLRGCTLRNTEWVMGVVVYTGHDTKIMMNAGITPSKRPRIARELNFNVACNFLILLFMCLICAIASGVFWAKTDSSAHFFDFGMIGDTPELSGFITFWAALILFQNLVPISLYITLEIVRLLQAIFIYSDIEMYYEPIDQPCIPKSWNISDDVGQIEYIFSDKTGTLTQNVMEFKKATINGQPYGEAYTEAQAGMQKRLGIDVVAEGERVRAEIAEAKVHALEGLRRIDNNQYLHDEDLTFIAPDFVADLAGESTAEQQAATEHFMLCLALCHTVIAEKVPGNPPKMVFKAQSPDEAALVATARDMGFTVLGSNTEGTILNVMGEERHYPILNTIEFNSTRKRMSSIVRMPNGRIILICKGADSVIYGRLKKGEQQELRQITAEHLEMFAREGLRTLCIAQRELTESEYMNWKREHDEAAASIDNREEKLEAVAELIEQDLTLLGGTAIEDRLQDGVPDTIALLGEAGIKLWVLTGDKVETAINIGFSCNLLNNDMELINLKVDEDPTGRTSDETMINNLDAELTKHLKLFGLTGSQEDLDAARLNHEAPSATHGIIIDGFTLRFVLHEQLKQKFLLLCKQCKSVLCCRVSPAQKAAVVSMVKNGLDVMTLSIGDGANDVAMIQEADVGVGIAGVEGRQAVMSSDYAIAQFRFLQRLVLVHGRWSYRRLAESISNFFYKNMVWTFSIFWYQIFCDFDITYIFEFSYIIMFNLFFTSLPVGLMGVFDQDVSDKVSLAVPQLYRRGIERLEWTQTKFWIHMVDGVYQSAVVFFIPFLYFKYTHFASESGQNIEDRTRIGAYIAAPAVLTINMYILINTYRWDWIIVLVVAISSLFVFFWTGVYTQFTASGVFFEAAQQVYGQPSFWAVFVIVPIICLFPRFVSKAIQKVYFPYDVDIIREQARMGHFDYLEHPKKNAGGLPVQDPTYSFGSSDSSRKGKHVPYGSVDEDQRPIYPPSVMTKTTTHHAHPSQTGSDGTNYTGHQHQRQSLDFGLVSEADAVPTPSPLHQQVVNVQVGSGGGGGPPPAHQNFNSASVGHHTSRPSIDRTRPSFDRMRASLDRVRPSFEASNDMTTAARLTRIESTQSARVRMAAAMAEQKEMREMSNKGQS